MEDRNKQLKTNYLSSPKAAKQAQISTNSVLSSYINIATACARTTYSSVYIINLDNHDFVFLSANPLILCGYSVLEVRDKGFAFFEEIMGDKEFKDQAKTALLCRSFFNYLPIEQRTAYCVSSDFEIQNVLTRRKVLVNLKFTPIDLNTKGEVLLALCVLSLAPSKNKRDLYIARSNSSECWNFSAKPRKWVRREDPTLNTHELEVVILAAQGYSIRAIANKMCKSIDTIKGYRKEVFRKLEVSNISEAISIVLAHHLII